MGKLYLDRLEIPKHAGLSKSLLNLVELGIPKLEEQSIFRSLYDIEIMGVTIYYRKKWHYDRQSESETA